MSSAMFIYFLQRLASISDAGINHASQLSNSFLGLPLEFGKCEACGATEPDKCEGKLVLPFCVYLFVLTFYTDIDVSFFVLGHFGYIHLPVPIYHPAHISELKQLLSLLCLKCLKIKKMKVSTSLSFLKSSFW